MIAMNNQMLASQELDRVLSKVIRVTEELTAEAKELICRTLRGEFSDKISDDQVSLIEAELDRRFHAVLAEMERRKEAALQGITTHNG